MGLREYAARQQATAATAATATKTAPIEKGFPYKTIYREMYDLHSRHVCPATLDEWQALIDDMVEVGRRCGESKFAQALMVAVYEEIERTAEGNKAEAADGS